MRTMIRYYCLCYGFFGTCAALFWYWAILWGHAVSLGAVWLTETVFAIHALAMIATFQRVGARHTWPPLIRVTRGRSQAAQALLAAGVVNFMGCFVAFFVESTRGEQFVSTRSVALVLASFLLVNILYIALHWILRPENFLSSRFIRTFSNPLGMIFRNPK